MKKLIQSLSILTIAASLTLSAVADQKCCKKGEKGEKACTKEKCNKGKEGKDKDAGKEEKSSDKK